MSTPNVTKWFLIRGIDLYKALVKSGLLTASGLVVGHCRFVPTCSTYSRQALTRYGAREGVRRILRRLMKCHPLHPGGWDPLI